jgi:hypothetical protein
MHRQLRRFGCFFGLVAAALMNAPASADFIETWESPAIAGGASSTSLPGSWVRFSGAFDESQIFHPNSTANFDQVEPLASPAGGNQLLTLAGVNTGISRVIPYP